MTSDEREQTEEAASSGRFPDARGRLSDDSAPINNEAPDPPEDGVDGAADQPTGGEPIGGGPGPGHEPTGGTGAVFEE